MLKILEGYNLADLTHLSPEYVYTVSMAMKAAWTDRANFIGDPAFVDVPVEDLLCEERAAAWRRRIDAREKITIPRWQPQEPPMHHARLRCGPVAQRGGADPLAGIGFGRDYTGIGLHVQ